MFVSHRHNRVAHGSGFNKRRGGTCVGFDDTGYTGIMHGSTIVFPAVLAVAQELDCSEDALITAFVAGSDITYVLADNCTQDHYFNGWQNPFC